MTRIVCKTPSTGRPLRLVLGDVPTTFLTIAQAPDFSVPDPSLVFPARDPLDATRAIRPGEIFFLTPIAVTNKTATARWIEVRLVTESMGLLVPSSNILSPGRVTVPPMDTAFIPIQGRSLLKRNWDGLIAGDQLQLRAEVANVFDVWVAAEERVSSEHIGVV